MYDHETAHAAALLQSEVIGMLHAFPMDEEPEETDEPTDPVLEPYDRLEVPGSYYVSSHGRLLRAPRQGRGNADVRGSQGAGPPQWVRAGEPAGLRAERGAVELYRCRGFEVIDRAPVTPHEVIRYRGESCR